MSLMRAEAAAVPAGMEALGAAAQPVLAGPVSAAVMQPVAALAAAAEPMAVHPHKAWIPRAVLTDQLAVRDQLEQPVAQVRWAQPVLLAQAAMDQEGAEDRASFAQAGPVHNMMFGQ